MTDTVRVGHPGWPVTVDVSLPAGWSWREDTEWAYLCSPEGVEAAFPAHTGLAVMSETAAQLCRAALEAQERE